MTIFLNTRAGGGTAEEKWKQFLPVYGSSCSTLSVHAMFDQASAEQAFLQAFRSGEREFVAAGGDGTINFLLNTMLKLIPRERHAELRLGAVGIGSSNDFHKPFDPSSGHSGIPSRTNFSTALPRDIGCVRFTPAADAEPFYFLINASVGVTAEGNLRFNKPDPLLRFLKRTSTSAAIMYAALRTIVGHRGLPARICSSAVGEITTSLTNLGIVKNPHFSGDLHYPSPIRYDSGRFDIHLCHDMNLFEKVRLLRSLSNGRFWTMRKTRSWESAELTISSEVQFPVEFDGEVVVTKFARFSILPQYLKVCTC